MAFQFDKLTHKSQEAIQRAVELATELGHQQIGVDHIAYALLKVDGGIIPVFLDRFNVSLEGLLKKLEETFEEIPSVTGDQQQPFLSKDANKALLEAQKSAKAMKDDYASQEHIFLALFKDEQSAFSKELRRNGVSEQDILKAIDQIRGGDRKSTRLNSSHIPLSRMPSSA